MRSMHFSVPSVALGGRKFGISSSLGVVAFDSLSSSLAKEGVQNNLFYHDSLTFITGRHCPVQLACSGVGHKFTTRLSKIGSI
jgi:hypothetical protein